MKRCARCSQLIAFGTIKRQAPGEQVEYFCSYDCRGAQYSTRFCETCLSETDDRSAGEVSSTNGFGSALLAGRSTYVCPACESVVLREWVTLFFLRVIPLRRYRVLHRGHDFVARRLKNRKAWAAALRARAVRCGPAVDIAPCSRGAFACRCGSSDPRHRWFPDGGDSLVARFTLSDGGVQLRSAGGYVSSP
jgi:hypothetical protein